MTRESTAMRLKALKAFPGFHDLPPEYLVALGAHAEQTTFGDGTYLQRAGADNERVAILLHGEVERLRPDREPERVRPYELVGGATALSDRPLLHDARADGEVTALVLRTGVARALIVDNLVVYAAVLANLGVAVRDLRDAAGPRRGHDSPRDEVYPPEISIVEKMLTLARADCFEQLPVDVLGAVARLGAVERPDAGARVTVRGDAATAAALPISGQLACEVEGCDVRIGPGQVAGLEDMLAEGDMPCTLVAGDETTVLRIPYHGLLDELEDDADACMSLLLGVARTAHALESA